MNITRNLLVAALMTIVTTLLFGIVYPLVMTGLAQAIFPAKANGQLIQRSGRVIGSRIIGQAFSSPAAHCWTSDQSALAASGHVRTRKGFTEVPSPAIVTPERYAQTDLVARVQASH